MLSEVINFIDTKLANLAYVPASKGLVEKNTIDGKEIPSAYCLGEWTALNIEESFIYHRLVGTISTDELDEEEQVSCEPYSQKDYPMRLVFCKKRTEFNNTIYDAQSVGEDLVNSIHILNNRALSISLGADTVQIQPSEIETNTSIAFNEEFGLDQIPLDYIFIYVDYTITITGANSCFRTLCQNEQ